MTLTHKRERLTFARPGWYFDSSDESIDTGADLTGSDRMLNRLRPELKARWSWSRSAASAMKWRKLMTEHCAIRRVKSCLPDSLPW
jgi:hypothetical protein